MSLSAGLVYATTPAGGFVSQGDPDESLDAEPEEPRRTWTREPGASPTTTAELVALAPAAVEPAPPRVEATSRVRGAAWAAQTARPRSEAWAAPPKPAAPQALAFAPSKRTQVDLDAFAPPQPPPPPPPQQQAQRIVSTSAPPQMPSSTAMPMTTSGRKSSSR
jgi:hypothetical protein